MNIKNAMVLAEAYTDAGLTFEMHVYPDAPHGGLWGMQLPSADARNMKIPALHSG